MGNIKVALVLDPGRKQLLLSKWPIPRLPRWTARVNEALSEKELSAIRIRAQRGRPLGDETSTESIVRFLNLEATIRPHVWGVR